MYARCQFCGERIRRGDKVEKFYHISKIKRWPWIWRVPWGAKKAHWSCVYPWEPNDEGERAFWVNFRMHLEK